ncbi:hypothetical protein J2S64_002668 [Paeniglutamicibacter sulfureus]|uniref:Uncharacterized protein n=1 Tax=Paeniglutamicibacter sulfureus TaxID=43666 RepID=A0ABU2BK20_9MICC|nr:hypothetical protein [Paeniglutamicibacter sulfureus]
MGTPATRTRPSCGALRRMGRISMPSRRAGH